MRPILVLVGWAVLGACDSGGDGSSDPIDAAQQDAPVSTDDAAPLDAGPLDAGPLDAAPLDAGPLDADVAHYSLLVTESPPGPINGDPLNWRGVQHYTLASTGGMLVPATGIDAASVFDPAGLTFRPDASEVLVGNRHGNNGGAGMAGSISRFTFDPTLRTLTAAGQITGNGLSAVHQLTINPATGELFAANFGGGISRFTFDAGGQAVANGTIGAGSMRGVLVSPDGTTLFATSAGNDVRRFDLSTGLELTSVTTGAGALLHYLAVRDGELYVAGLGTNTVYRLTIGAAGTLTLKDTIAASSPLAIAFSEDGREMFVAGHQSTDVLQRYEYDLAGDSWTPTDMVATSQSLGGLVVLP